MSDACDSKAYRNGKTFEECRQEAREKSLELSSEIAKIGQISWSRVMEAARHDELVYKLCLKYLRELGFDIGSGSDKRVSEMKMRK